LDWLPQAELRAALGQAYGELDLFKQAVTHYEAALQAERAQFSVQTVEQFCNLQTRYAAQLVTSDRVQAEKLIGEAKQRLVNLNRALGETSERLSLLGSIHKREALIASTRTERQRALKAMSESYKNAFGSRKKQHNQIDPYPLLNWLLADTLLGFLGVGPGKPEQFEELLQHADIAAAERDRSDPNFWNAVTPADSFLLKHLADRDLQAHADDVVAKYLDAKKRDASPREFRSVLEHVDFLSDILSLAREKSVKDNLGKALRTIRQKLTT
jgi:tetratricopeptide (TPR) repeat protein